MNTTATPGNTEYVATLLNRSQDVSQHRTDHQSAAMQAALLVRCQYSNESKTQFRRVCLDHLKASLALQQKASA